MKTALLKKKSFYWLIFVDIKYNFVCSTTGFGSFVG